MTSIQEEIPADIRKEAERVVFGWYDGEYSHKLINDVAAALLAERNRAYEECAGIADKLYDQDETESDAGERIAAAIRALLK